MCVCVCAGAHLGLTLTVCAGGGVPLGAVPAPSWCGEVSLGGIHIIITVDSTERISEIWFREPFWRWGVLRFRRRVRFTSG